MSLSIRHGQVLAHRLTLPDPPARVLQQILFRKHIHVEAMLCSQEGRARHETFRIAHPQLLLRPDRPLGLHFCEAQVTVAPMPINMRVIQRQSAAPCYPSPMSRETQALLEAFDHLPAEEKRAFAQEVLRRSLPFDSGQLSDEEIGAASDALWQSLDDEEDGDAAAR